MKPSWIETDNRKSWAKKRDKRYDTRWWRGLRANHLSRNPLCVECLKQGKYTDCTGKGKGVVDHKHEVTKGGSFDDPTNLQTLCTTCHNKKTAINKNK